MDKHTHTYTHTHTCTHTHTHWHIDTHTHTTHTHTHTHSPQGRTDGGHYECDCTHRTVTSSQHSCDSSLSASDVPSSWGRRPEETQRQRNGPPGEGMGWQESKCTRHERKFNNYFSTAVHTQSSNCAQLVAIIYWVVKLQHDTLYSYTSTCKLRVYKI